MVYFVPMLRTRSSFLSAFLLLVGTIIGAGVFGVPLVFSRMGVLTGTVVFWIVALFVTAAHLLFVEVIAQDRELRRLPGYVGHVLGRSAEGIAALSHSLHLIGANLAYLILGGEFLAVLIGRLVPGFGLLGWQALFWIAGIVTVLAGLRMLSRVESIMAWVEIGSMALIALIACASIRGGFSVETHWPEVTMGLGVFVFALTGLTIIPEVYELTGRKVWQTRRVTLLSSLLTALLTWLFGIGVYLAASHEGQLGSAAAITSILPASIGWLLPLFGFFAVATSYLTTAYDLRSMCVYDLKWPPLVASICALGMPFVLLLVMSRDFFQTIDIVGAVFSASNSILIAIAAMIVMHRVKKRPPFWWRTAAPVLTALLFGYVLIQRLIVSGVH